MITIFEFIRLNVWHPCPLDSLQILPQSSPPCTYLPLPRNSYSWRNAEAVSRLNFLCLVHDVIFLYLFTFWPHFFWAINIWKFKQIGQFSPNITKLIQIVSPNKTSKNTPRYALPLGWPFYDIFTCYKKLGKEPWGASTTGANFIFPKSRTSTPKKSGETLRLSCVELRYASM